MDKTNNQANTKERKETVMSSKQDKKDTQNAMKLILFFKKIYILLGIFFIKAFLSPGIPTKFNWTMKISFKFVKLSVFVLFIVKER